MDKIKVLIIEDDKFFGELVSKNLIRENFEVFVAHDSKETFSYLESNTPNLILLDLILPGMDGYEILSVLKNDQKTKDVPVIILSNLGQREEIEKAKELAATDFMIKVNFTPDEIVERVKKTLK